jgi:poly(A)-specific ribonuclease
VSGKEEKAAEVSAKRSEGDNEVDRELRNAVGFRRILDALIALKKPIVGHNCLLDFLHIHDKLMGKLPATLDDFTSGLHEAFPRIFDSKVINRHLLPCGCRWAAKRFVSCLLM